MSTTMRCALTLCVTLVACGPARDGTDLQPLPDPGGPVVGGGEVPDDGQAVEDGTATLVFVNESDWKAFDALGLWECSGNLAESFGFDIDGWLDPGETWTLTGVPTDICFRAELWNFNVDYGVEWPGSRFEPGEHRLVVAD